MCVFETLSNAHSSSRRGRTFPSYNAQPSSRRGCTYLSLEVPEARVFEIQEKHKFPYSLIIREVKGIRYDGLESQEKRAFRQEKLNSDTRKVK